MADQSAQQAALLIQIIKNLQPQYASNGEFLVITQNGTAISILKNGRRTIRSQGIRNR